MADRRKPLQSRSSQLVADVLTAATEVISRAGVEKATIEGVAKRAGVSPGSLYQYFSGKRALFGGAVVSELEHNRQVVLEQLEKLQELPIRDLNRRMITLIVELHSARAGILRNVYKHASELGRVREHMQMRRDVIEALARILERHRDELVVSDCRRAATVVVHAAMGALTASYIDETLPDSPADFCEEIIQMIDRYLLGPTALNAAKS